MQSKLLNYIKRHELFRRGDSVLVAVSGGADSVALLCALHEISRKLVLSLTAAHLNHCIRGRASDGDEDFVKKLAKRLKISFISGRKDVPKFSRKSGMSLEMAARMARYDFLFEAARKTKANVVATAHTADDQAETVLLKLARGAGPRGLAGIPRESSIGGMKIVRPLLDVRRSEIESFLKAHNQAWREDKSNHDPAYLRNRVRHEVLPFLEKKLNPDIRTALLRTADLLREEDNWLEELSTKILKHSTIPSPLGMRKKIRQKTIPSPPGGEGQGEGSVLLFPKLKSECLAARRRVLRCWLSGAGIAPEQIDFDVIARCEALMQDSKGTGEMEVAGNWIVKRRYDRLIVEQSSKKSAKSFRQVLKIPGETIVGGKLKIVSALKPGLVKDKIIGVGHLPSRASIDLTAVGKRKIIVRSWRKGDRMKPFGMAGSKKLQDIFTDGKVPVEQRSQVPVFECGKEIIWIPGYRVAQGWEVRNPLDVSIQLMVEITGSHL